MVTQDILGTHEGFNKNWFATTLDLIKCINRIPEIAPYVRTRFWDASNISTMVL